MLVLALCLVVYLLHQMAAHIKYTNQYTKKHTIYIKEITNWDYSSHIIAALGKIGSFGDGPMETVEKLRFHLKQQNGKKLAVKAWGWSRNV